MVQSPVDLAPAPVTDPAPRVLAKKREILRAAAEVFRAKGLQGAGMRDIAAAWGGAVGNLYYYFQNKQEIVAFCQQDGLAGLLALAESVHALPASAPERLARWVAGHVVLVNEATPGALAHIEIEQVEEPWRTGLLAQRDAYRAALERLIAEGVAAGEFRPVDARLAALAVLGAVNWTVRWFQPAGELSAQAIGRHFAEHLVRGLLAPGTPFALPAEEAAP